MIRFSRSIRPLLERGTKIRLVVAALLSVGLAILEAAGLVLLLPLVQLLADSSTKTWPSSAGWLASRLDHPTPMHLAAVLAAVVFGLFVSKGVAAVLFLRWNLATILDSEARVARRLLRAYLRAPYAFHLQRNSAELQRTVHNSVEKVFSDGLVAMVGGTADAIVIVAIAVVLVVAEPLVAACAAVYFALVGITYQRLVHGRARSVGNALHHNLKEALQVVQQSVGAVREVKLRHAEDHFVEQLYATKRSSAARMRTLMLLFQVPRYYLETSLLVGVGVLGAVVFQLRPAAEATAVLGLFLAAGFRLLPSVNRVIVAASAVGAATGPLEQIKDDLRAAEEDAEPGGAPGPAGERATEADIPAPLGPATLELDHVSFSYEGSDGPVLHDVTLTVRPGEAVAFVGASGAGKSTLLDVILGLLDPDSGSVRIDGRHLAEARAAWQLSIGYVPQDVALLDDTFRANVAFGCPPRDVDEDRLRSAIAMAQLSELVAELPEGLGTRVGEAGARLSGGQRQRLGIARALYHDPAVLVLDEATSALDSATERKVAETVDALRGRRTLVSVTHRLATVRSYDRVHLLEKGRVVASGRFDELLASSARFRQLVTLAGVGAVGASPVPGAGDGHGGDPGDAGGSDARHAGGHGPALPVVPAGRGEEHQP